GGQGCRDCTAAMGAGADRVDRELSCWDGDRHGFGRDGRRRARHDRCGANLRSPSPAPRPWKRPDDGDCRVASVADQLPHRTALRPGVLGALSTMIVTTVVYWAALVALERPWVEGDTQADVRRK